MTILAIRRADGRMLINPHPNTVLREQDTLIVLGSRAAVEHVNTTR